MPTIPARVIATCLALTGFAGAVVVGIAAGNEPAVVLTRAILIMLGCVLVGGIIGRVAQRMIDLHVERHKRDNPIPDQGGAGKTPENAAASQSA